ncbi:MAG TPA: SDR family NAD(P)-dependent oxidoreductase, partial [Acidimicrobiales bacterium]|nr:SDR family NAD(P)-dependent oxidoreductase [Acidimicrobiales bacterium]
MGKVVLITGASSGIGLVTADRLHQGGWTVLGASRRATGGAGWTPV